MGKLNLLKELFSNYAQTSLTGVLRYVRYKLHCKKNNYVPKIGSIKSERGISILGAGQYVASIHLPILRVLNQPVSGILSKHSKSSAILANLYKIPKIYQTVNEMLSASDSNAFLLATPPNQHAQQLVSLATTGSYIYCEKPVCISQENVNTLLAMNNFTAISNRTMVGFNRRFAPAITFLLKKKWLRTRKTPLEIHYRVNYGPEITNNMSHALIGGGRIHGAACHYVDLISFLAGASIKTISSFAVANQSSYPNENTFICNFFLSDGSIASLTFTSQGKREFDAKEEIIISCDGHNARIKDFSKLCIDKSMYHFYRYTYGAKACLSAFFDAKNANMSVPIPLVDGINATRITLAIQQSLKANGRTITLAFE